MPLYRRLPKRGFNSLNNKKKTAIINLDKIQSLIDKKIISASDKIDLNLLQSKKIIKKSVKYFKILGKGNINIKVNIDTNLLSKSAKDKLSKSGSISSIKDTV